ncbi:MAG: substrate-binding domain-containing protein [Spirochaetales bacterium]|nr:substrate-binding domain-containing protein [Spirochaetales bacterium]
MPGSRMIIGVLIDEFEGRYQRQVWKGIMDAAVKRSATLLFFVGKRFESPFENEIHQNQIYKFVDVTQLDGIISFSTALSNLCGANRIAEFLNQFREIPIVSIGLSFEHIPSIRMDNKTGMKKAIEHLIVKHGHKKIAFVTGTENNQDSQERFEGYREALSENGLEFDPDIVVSGDFTFPSGKEALVKLLDEKKVDIDAIAFCNDDMAFSALNELQVRGIPVPERLAVIGFDNLEEVALFSPPLTTVNQPLYDQGFAAFETLYARITRQEVSEQTLLPTELVIRESCGCFNLLNERESNTASQKKHPAKGKLLLGIIEKKTGAILSETVELLKNRFDPAPYLPSLNELLASLIDDIRERGKAFSFLKKLEKFIEKESYIHRNRWHTIVHSLYTATLSLAGGCEDVFILHQIFHHAQIFIGDQLSSHEAGLRLELHGLIWELREMMRNIHSSFRFSDLIKHCSVHLPDLMINTCYIALYKKRSYMMEAGHFTIPEYSRLIMDLEQGEFKPVNKLSPYHETIGLLYHLCGRNNGEDCFIIMPLVNRENHLGFILFGLGKKDPIVYETLREQIGEAIQTILLFKQEKKVKNNLKEALQKLKKSEEHFKEIAVMLPTIIIETNNTLNITFLNNAGQDLFGIKSLRKEDRHFLLDFIHPEDVSKIREFTSRIIGGGFSPFFEFRALNASKQFVSLLCRAGLIVRKGSIRGIRWNVIDIKPLMSSVLLPEESFYKEFHFSSREKEVFLLLLQGNKIKDIAKKLFIAESTVKNHIGAIYSEMDVKNKDEFFDKLKDYQIKHFGYESFIFSLLSRLMKG